LTAVKAAAIQQRLMVAALSCDAAQLYNKFVSTYQKDLQASDRALQNFFRRMNGKSGTEDYHAFKTRLANASSMQSIGDITAYCSSAKAIFDTALNADKPVLTAFVANQETSVDNQLSPCQVLTAGNGSAPPAAAPVPRGKPVAAVLPAQGAGLSTPR